MNKTTTLLFLSFVFSIQSYGQTNSLSEQELTVIKSYQYDVESSAVIHMDVDYEVPSTDFVIEEYKADLLPVTLNDITYEIKPIAHEVGKSQTYKGYAYGRLGTMNDVMLDLSYRHQVPNYFMYGLDASFQSIKDSQVLNKANSQRKATGFLRYYVRPSFWMEYGLDYEYQEFGLFGFQEQEDLLINEQNISDQYQTITHHLGLYKSFDKQDISIQLNNALYATSNPTFRDKEHLISSTLDINKPFSKGWELNLNSQYDGLISTINGSDLSEQWVNEIAITKTQNKIGFKIASLYIPTYENSILPNAELFFKNKNNELVIKYDNEFSFNSFYGTQQRLFLQDRRNYSGSTTQQTTYGLKYEFVLPQQHMFSISAHDITLKDDLVWVNNINDIQRFNGEHFDYSYYELGLKYHLCFNKYLAIAQGGELNILKELTSDEIPHFQTYVINTELLVAWKKIKLDFSYEFGNSVIYSENISNYRTHSDYMHNLSATIDYQLTDATSLSLTGIDLLNNKFEQYGGYSDYGRRINVSVTTKF